MVASTEHPAWQANMTWLAHTQFLQNIVTPLVVSFPCWSDRSTEYFRYYSAALEQLKANTEVSSDEWDRGLMEIKGYEDIPADALQRSFSRLQSDGTPNQFLHATPRQVMFLLEEFTSHCTPWDYPEWLQFGLLAFADMDARRDLLLATAVVVEALRSSIDAGLVAYDILGVEIHSPVEAFARAMTWFAEFLALTENSWPTRAEIDTIVAEFPCRIGPRGQLHELTLGSMALAHPMYSGKRDTRFHREHPFLFQLTRESIGPPHGEELLLEIDHEGNLIGLCVSSLTITGHGERNRTGIVLDSERKCVHQYISDYRRKNRSNEPTMQEITRSFIGEGVSMGHGKLQQILDEMRANGDYSIPARKRGVIRG